jgi:predicted PolB exonuclease-like 3'-5' exonuclease
MNNSVIVWDLETVPDLQAAARVGGIAGGSETEIRESLGEKFPKLPLHKIVCIGAVVAGKADGVWGVEAIGAPHTGERSEKELITSFVEKVAAYRPQLVTFNGNSFDLPVLRYRAMMHRIDAPGLECRPYFKRYTDDCLDLCDALSSFDARSKMKLHDLSRAFGFPGKPEGIDGSQVEQYVNDGRISEVAQYCETDVINTYRIWLLHELFRGALSLEQHEKSETCLDVYISNHLASKPYLHAYVRTHAAKEFSTIL